MEKVEYTQGKRYADIMKTMWFTFFYCSCIPIGILVSAASLIYYYWVDKYNVLKRRTIKETLSREVSIEMIEMLELCVVWFALGSITFQKELYGLWSLIGFIQLGLGLLYFILPMEVVIDTFFHIENKDETVHYAVA